jgi:hypothetical protein
VHGTREHNVSESRSASILRSLGRHSVECLRKSLTSIAGQPISSHSQSQSQSQSKSQSYVMTDSQSASLSWCHAPIWDPRPIFSFFFKLLLDSYGVVYVGAPSLTRGRVCRFQLLPGIGSADFLRSEWTYFIVSIFETPPQPGGSSSPRWHMEAWSWFMCLITRISAAVLYVRQWTDSLISWEANSCQYNFNWHQAF